MKTMGERPIPAQSASDPARSVADFLKRSKLAAIPPLSGSNQADVDARRDKLSRS